MTKSRHAVPGSRPQAAIPGPDTPARRHHVRAGETITLTLDAGPGLDPITAVGSGAVHEKHRSALAEIIAKLNERFGDKYSSGAIDATVGNIVAKLAIDDGLLQQAGAKTPHQFADSPALPKAFNQAMIDVRHETPQIVDDIFGDPDLHTLLSKALPAMLYEHLKDHSVDQRV